VPATPAEPATGTLALPEKPSIAVLPFQNMSGDPEQEYFADGMVEDIITALARFPSLFVIARNSSFSYKGHSPDIRQVGRELGVRYVLEGSVHKAGSKVRITGQLIEAATGTHLWADRYDGELDDVFALQDRITESVAGVIAPSIEKAEIERARRKPTGNLDAYDLYLRALPLNYGLVREDHEEAIALLRRSIEIEPAYAPAHFALGRVLVLCVAQGWADTATVGAEAMQCLRRALRIDRHNAEAIACLARGIAYLENRYDEPLSLVETAVTLNPSCATAWMHSGWVQL
jgi:TolB-like protein